MTLTKADLVQQVYKTHPSMTKAQATNSVEAFLSISKAALINGNDLLLSGFGKFNVKNKKSRRGRNPQTGDELTLECTTGCYLQAVRHTPFKNQQATDFPAPVFSWVSLR